MNALQELESGWSPETAVDDSILRRFLFNQAEVQATLATAAGGRIERTPDVALADTGTPVAYLNQATLMRPVTDADDRVLDHVTEFFRNGSIGLFLSAWPTPDLSRRGWMLVGHPMFVVRGPASASAYDAPLRPDVSVRIAETADDLAMVERIVADGYPVAEMADLPPNQVLGQSLVSSAVVHRIGYLDGVPVAAAANQVGHGVVNLSLAATLPTARRRGVWQALVNARCADAPDLPAVAFTSDYSRPGFVRMGFLPLMRFTLWIVC